MTTSHDIAFMLCKLSREVQHNESSKKRCVFLPQNSGDGEQGENECLPSFRFKKLSFSQLQVKSKQS